MCGFTGLCFSDRERMVDPVLLRSMTDVIHHRGPDEDGYYCEKNTGFGFRRLSIIDLHGGHQPMADDNNLAWIVFNGEIYNYRELRNDLLSKNYKFRTNSDTEVILNSYLEYGENFVTRLRGMFAFVIFDRRENKLVAARDHFGVKPLYFLADKDKFVFGSELKTILRSGLCRKELDWQAVDSYFSYGYIMAPLSIYKDVRKLSPGTLMVIRNGAKEFTYETRRYYTFRFSEPSNLSFESYVEMLDAGLSETVSAHMVSDVPVGAFLSGGIDSNAVVSKMARLSPSRIKTFSIGFKEQEYNEAELAKKSAQFYGTEHHELYLEPDSLDTLEKISGLYDEPFSDTSAIPTYFVSRLAAQHVKVVLSGDGGDEFFCGYNSYQRYIRLYNYRHVLRLGAPAMKLASSMMPANMKGKRFLYNLSRNPLNFQANQVQLGGYDHNRFYNRDYSESIRKSSSLGLKTVHLKNSTPRNYVEKMMELDINTYMADDILTKVDRASMANSLEVRVPLIDPEFAKISSQIPLSMKLNGTVGKYILRETVKKNIPDFIYSKPKTGFSIPEAAWFKGDMRIYFGDMLLGNKTSGIINDSYIRNILEHKRPKGLITKLWPILVFENFMKNQRDPEN